MSFSTDSIPVSRRPIVLIATDNVENAESIGGYLGLRGIDARFSYFDGETLKQTPTTAPDAILISLSAYADRAAQLAHILKGHFSPRDIPVISALPMRDELRDDVFASMLFEPVHPAQIATRVQAIVRLQAMETEIVRRVETLREDFGIDHTLQEPTMAQPFRILFIGKATPEFMVIINALQRKNVEVVAAFSSFSAFDFLHERTFDAVVMNTLVDTEPAFTISDTMRRNSKLFHVPTLFLVNPETFNAHTEAFKKGASDIINAHDDLDEISGRVLELANYHRTHKMVKREFAVLGNAETIDKETGLFNAEFLTAHLSRMMSDMKAEGRPLSLHVMRTRPSAAYPLTDAALSTANRQIGSMIRNLVRVQDCVARLGPDTFAIAFAGQPRAVTQTVLSRIHGVIDCTAFDHADAQSGPFTIAIDSTLVDMMGYESSYLLINHALAELGLEPFQASA